MPQIIDSVIQAWTPYRFCVCRRMISWRQSSKMNRYCEVGRGMSSPKFFELFYITKTSQLCPLIIDVSRSHSGTLQSAFLLWTSDNPNAETSTWYDTTLTRTGINVPDGIRTHISSNRAASHPRLRPRGQRESIDFEPII